MEFLTIFIKLFREIKLSYSGISLILSLCPGDGTCNIRPSVWGTACRVWRLSWPGFLRGPRPRKQGCWWPGSTWRTRSWPRHPNRPPFLPGPGKPRRWSRPLPGGRTAAGLPAPGPTCLRRGRNCWRTPPRRCSLRWAGS